ncbi:aldo/keto reductase [Erwinia sp. INIA-01]|uniref:aldo/keto reductase n=1 Tax=Erwinia sp. INIA01 TaxID=2991500 RepID=UPI00222524CC|nr:aldo/keto reductase [Erwinia sp. INIA01]MCW1874245.1 aldo/keto reductase [Erwinia sp. INIA01]
MTSPVNKIPTLRLGNHGREIGIQGLGCMGISEFYGPTDIQNVEAVIETAIEQGVNMFDTADMYGLGENERFLSPWVRRYRDKMFICTKFGYTRTPENPYDWSIDNRPEYIRTAVNRSLQRMQIDCIDLYYMHRRDPAVPLSDSIGTLADLVVEGKIGAVGLSAVNGDELREASAIHPISALQSEWSLFSRDIEQDVIPVAAELGITLVPYAPLGRGLLTNSTINTVLAENDARHHFPRFTRENLAANALIVAKVSAIAEAKNMSTAQVALAWLYTKAREMQISAIPIPGTRNRQRLAENLAAASMTLSINEMAELNELAEQIQGSAI